MADDDEEVEVTFSYGMYKSEGNHYFARGLTTQAASNYSKVLNQCCLA